MTTPDNPIGDTIEYTIEVDSSTFEEAVIAASHERPVIVDFWAAWCGPCRQLTPMLERAVAAQDGRVLLAKVDVDANPALAQRYSVRGIPQVIGFRDGTAVAQFTGVRPEAQVTSFIEDLLPTEVDQAVARARSAPGPEAIAELERALALQPDHREAAIGLAELVRVDDPDRALALVTPHRPDPAAEAVLTRLALASNGGDVTSLRARVEAGDASGDDLLALGRALAADDAHEEAIEQLLAAVRLGGEVREPAREQLVRLFALLGDQDPRVLAARPRLARALF